MKKKVICIIPARGGSKGIIKKNLQKVGGKPLIYYAVQAAIQSKVCDIVFVSTDCPQIAKEAIKFGAEVPFLRKKNFAKDYTTTEKTLKNALKEIEKFKNTKYDICVFLSCTNIFRKISWIREAVNILKKNSNIDSAFSVHKIYKHFWTLDKKKLVKVCKWMSNYTSRQIAPKLFREDTGLACATKAKFWRMGKRIGKKVHLIENSESITGIDIHNKLDLKVADFLIKDLRKSKNSDYFI